jgi:GWxTD domain-containing protein
MGRVLMVCLLAPVVAAMLQATAPTDREWKRWLDDVRPLLLPSEAATAKTLPPSARVEFREGFWRWRDPDPATADNPVRAQFGSRVLAAEKRFRVNGTGGWNDCGRTFVVLGKPDRMHGVALAAHFAGDDPLAAFREQEDKVAEVWTYRNHPRLPQTPEGLAFRFTPNCEAVGGPSVQRLLQAAAASYVVRNR